MYEQNRPGKFKYMLGDFWNQDCHKCKHFGGEQGSGTCRPRLGSCPVRTDADDRCQAAAAAIGWGSQPRRTGRHRHVLSPQKCVFKLNPARFSKKLTHQYPG